MHTVLGQPNMGNLGTGGFWRYTVGNLQNVLDAVEGLRRLGHQEAEAGLDVTGPEAPGAVRDERWLLCIQVLSACYYSRDNLS
jgi:hypothetical protein